MAAVVNIRGIPGSGKTWICKALGASVPCYDTDDILTAAYKQVRKRLGAHGTERKIEQAVGRQAAALMASILAKHKERKTPVVVVAGITVPVRATHKYFIKMTDTDIKKAYRRVLQRELRKITSNAKELSKIIKNAPVNAVNFDISLQFHVEAVKLKTSFQSYISEYKNACRSESHNGFAVLSQADIVKAVKALP